MRAEYIKTHDSLVASMNLKAGDTVKVVRGLPHRNKGCSEYLGWPDSWMAGMDKCIGKEFIVVGFSATSIIFQSYNWPIFVLEKIFEPNTFKLSDNYTAVVEEDGTVVVGCQKIPHDLLEKIYLSSKKNKEKAK